MPFARLLALLAAAFVILGCPEPKEPPHLLYEQDAQSLDNPFPDLRLVTDQGFQARPEWYRPFLMPKAVTAKIREFFKAYSESAIQVKGVGNFGPTLLRVSEPVDRSTLAGTAARLRKTASGYEVLEAEVLVIHSGDSLEGTGKEGAEGFPEFLVVRPSVVLPEGDEGLLVIKRGIRTAGGVALGRGFSYEKEKGSAERIKAAAQALGVPEAEVLLVLPLKAEPVTATLKSLADWTVSTMVPSVTIPAKGIIPDEPGTRPVGGWTSADSDWATMRPWLEKNAFATPADKVGSVVVGSFQSRDLRENGIWKKEWVEAPASAPGVELRFVLSLPAGAKPAGGWPVVIGGHGLGGRNTLKMGEPDSFCLEMAQLLAQRGFGCLGIDATSHGSRGNQFDFFAIEDMAKARDNFRQMTFDQLQLARSAAAIDVDADGTPDLSPELGYFGQSLGGIMGASFVSMDPRVKFAVLNVPGGGLSNVLASEDIRDRVGLLIVAKTGLTFESPEYYGAFGIFRTVAQLFLETGDPINLVQALGKDKGMLLQEGVGDLTIPNFTTEDLARAARIPASTTPASGTTPLQVLFRVDPAQYLTPAQVKGMDPHGVFWSVAPSRVQAMRFLESRGTVFVLE